jgi:crossover junction endodeoxyribonuclease RuvC
VQLHTPSEVKAAITGSGVADKAQVTAMVTRILKLSVAPRPADAADALALAICQIWRGSAQDRLAAARRSSIAKTGADVAGGLR